MKETLIYGHLGNVNMMTLDFDTVGKNEIKAIPEEAGVYVLEGHLGEVLYVGETTDLKARLRVHLKGYGASVRFAKELAIAHFTPVMADKHERAIIEGLLINRLDPKYNFNDAEITTSHTAPNYTNIRKAGERGSYNQLTKEQFYEIRDHALRSSLTNDVIGERFGVTGQTVRNIKNLTSKKFKKWEEERMSAAG